MSTTSPEHTYLQPYPVSSVDLCGCPSCLRILEARHKFQAGLVLCHDLRQPNTIKVPTYAEWIGLNLRDRDGETQGKTAHNIKGDGSGS